MTDETGNAPSTPALTIIWAALAVGVLTFAVLVFVLGPTAGDGRSGAWRWAWFAAALVAIFAAGIVRGRLRRDPRPEQIRASAILIWALGEGQALLGLVLYFVTGDSTPAIVGLAVGAWIFLRHRPASFPEPAGGS